MRRRRIATLTVQSELLPLLREVVRRGGHLPLLARGDSMRPAIRSGDRLVLGPVGPGEPRVGDVVVWSDGRRAVIHRVLAVRGRRLKTRGDSRLYDDGWLDASALLARVVRPEREPTPGALSIVRRWAPPGRRLLASLRARLFARPRASR